MTMELLTPLITIGAAMLLGIMSPGPSFVLVARTSAALDRQAGLATALGMGFGGAIFALAAVLGLHVVLTTMPNLYIALQIVGALYLVRLAYLMWSSAHRPLDLVAARIATRVSLRQSFLSGLATQIGNPKTAIVYGSVFASAMPQTANWGLGLMIVAMLFTLELAWYAIVALFFSSDEMQRRYGRSKAVFDRVAAGAMGALGAKIMFDLAGRVQRGAA